MKKCTTLFFFFIIFITNINYSFSIEPDVFVQSTVNRAARTLGGNLTKTERVDKLKEIAKETVDISGIGFYSLGKHRKGLSSTQLENYKKVFLVDLLNTQIQK